MGERITSTKWGMNLWASVDDAVDSAERNLVRGAGYWVWRTDDGLYDYSAPANQTSERLCPHLQDADLVFHGHTYAEPSRLRTCKERCATCSEVTDG